MCLLPYIFLPSFFSFFFVSFLIQSRIPAIEMVLSVFKASLSISVKHFRNIQRGDPYWSTVKINPHRRRADRAREVPYQKLLSISFSHKGLVNDCITGYNVVFTYPLRCHAVVKMRSFCMCWNNARISKLLTCIRTVTK